MQSTPIQRARRAHSQAQPSATPFSRTAAKLIEQIRAEARASLLEELSAKDAIVVLHPVDAATRRISHTGQRIEVSDERGAEYYSFRRHIPEDNSNTHPAHWLACIRLVDGQGRKWYSHPGPLVCDDFGNLVEVPA